MKSRIIQFFSLSLTVFLCSCATIMSGPNQEFTFRTEPTRATVRLNGMDIGKTPLTRNLDRSNSYEVEITMPGYKPYYLRLEKGFNGWYIGNILFGGIVGLIVDPLTGAIYTLTPEDELGNTPRNMWVKSDFGNLTLDISMTPVDGQIPYDYMEEDDSSQGSPME